MTTDAERECYYRLAKEAAGKGAVVEFGAWMGASTAYIAAGLRDSGVRTRALVYDHFKSKPGHIAKVKTFYQAHGIDKVPVGPCLETFTENLGPLMDWVEPRPGKIEEISWRSGAPIALLISDAPKRVPAISAVLKELRDALRPGAIMAWQDFCHFPSYEIPACLYRLRDHLEFVEAVVPGTTLVFRVKSSWSADEVSPEALALSKWKPSEMFAAWAYWVDGGFVPDEKLGLFWCGLAMFACDVGEPDRAVAHLAEVYSDHADAITPKWKYLKANRPDFLTRYAPLFAYLGSRGAV
jgi:hypothetical protein